MVLNIFNIFFAKTVPTVKGRGCSLYGTCCLIQCFFLFFSLSFGNRQLMILVSCLSADMRSCGRSHNNLECFQKGLGGCLWPEFFKKYEKRGMVSTIFQVTTTTCQNTFSQFSQSEKKLISSVKLNQCDFSKFECQLFCDVSIQNWHSTFANVNGQFRDCYWQLRDALTVVHQ